MVLIPNSEGAIENYEQIGEPEEVQSGVFTRIVAHKMRLKEDSEREDLPNETFHLTFIHGKKFSAPLGFPYSGGRVLLPQDVMDELVDKVVNDPFYSNDLSRALSDYLDRIVR